MKKFASIFAISLTLLLLSSSVAYASVCPAPYDQGLVPCGQLDTCRCDLSDVFVMLKRLYIFMVWYIGMPLAGLLVVIGGIFILLQGLNPKLYDTGKTILWGAFWGVVLMLCSYLIVDVVLKGLGYTGVWSSF